jgi:SAM-dependent methyltransferase
MNDIFSRVKELTKLIFLGLLVKSRNLVEFGRVFRCYYHNSAFLKVDFLMFLHYFFRGPFNISKCFLIEKGDEDIYNYGETPLTVMEKMTKEAECSPNDIVFELGCGRGKTVFWLNSFLQCKVVGIEIIPLFVEKARSIKQWLKVKDVEFRNEDMLTTDYSAATIIYLYGTKKK